MKLKNLKGIIFDVHKTLVDDSGFPRERIWKLMCQAGATFTMVEYYRLYDELTKQLFNWANIDRFVKIKEIHKQRLASFYKRYHVRRNLDQDLKYLWRSMRESKIYPEVHEVLDKMKNRYKLGLLSNADDDDPLISILLQTGFHFDAIVTSESVGAYKPKPIIFQKILTEMGCEKHQVILVGDSLISDVLGATNFGIKVVWINRIGKSHDGDYPKPDHQISDLRQLFNIVEV